MAGLSWLCRTPNLTISADPALFSSPQLCQYWSMGVLPVPTTSMLPPLPEGWHVLKCKLLDGPRLAIIGADVDMLAAWQSAPTQQTAGEPWRLAAKATCKLWMFQDDQLIDGVQFPMLEPFPIVEQFPDGRWLVVNGRSRGNGNARILGPDGAELQRIEVGDGIEHVKIDAQGRIWVGWFDEGVFGNSNWQCPGHKWPPSSHGIAAFDDKGALLSHATLAMADCYALNVLGDEAWATTYPDFPIWRMKPGQERVWTTSLSGVCAIAVNFPNVLAAGGYQDEANQVVLLRLEEEGARALAKWRLPFDVGLSSGVTMIDGRDDELHVVQDKQWHRWRVADFAESD